MSYIAIYTGIIAIVLLIFLIVAVWFGLGRGIVALSAYRKVRAGIAVLGTLYAVISIYRIVDQVTIPQKLDQAFVPELVGYSLFWVLAPPLWFFFEYLAANTDWIVDLARTPDDLKIIKDYMDLSSKIWAAVLAIIVGLIAIKHY